jgi:hypothetical protein
MKRTLLLTALLAACSSSESPANDGAADASTTDAERDAPPSPPPPPPPVDGALGTIVLGNPTDTSLTLNLMTKAELEVYFEYGPAPDAYASKTDTVKAAPNVPAVFKLSGLTKDAGHHYRARYRTPGGGEFAASDDRPFHTQRASSQAFKFTIQSDSHRDENSSFDLYKRTLANIRADRPDFHVDLGDTFMTEKFAKSNDDVVKRYIEERDYFGLITDVTPLFLVNGNHEGEQGWQLNGTENNQAIWASRARLTYYVNPLPDGFYSGNTASEPVIGQRGGFYAWTWGDALFIALDPFWFTKVKPGKTGSSGWTWTLGEAQYRWLESTLKTSTAKYKFVFSHHMIGGGADGRLGTEVADLWEWGGKNTAGVDEFAIKRPGWSKPIHQLLADAKVSAWFHGHDHLFVRQEKDGIAYYEVPQPSHLGDNGAMTAKQWGYTQGKVLSSSGHMRVSVSSEKAVVEYVQAFLPADETTPKKNGFVGDTFTIVPR